MKFAVHSKDFPIFVQQNCFGSRMHATQAHEKPWEWKNFLCKIYFRTRPVPKQAMFHPSTADWMPHGRILPLLQPLSSYNPWPLY